MTSDDLISMHKACERVIEEMQALEGQTCHRECIGAISTARAATLTLATVQRDLLASMLRASLGGI